MKRRINMIHAGRCIGMRFGGIVKMLAVGVAIGFAGSALADSVEFKNDVYWTYSDDGSTVTILSVPKDTEGELNIPKTLGAYTVSHIAADAFKDCTLITSAFIPSDVEDVGTSAFEGCTSLESVLLTGTMTSLPDRMFKGCTALKSVDLSVYNLVSIGNNAFGGCTALESIRLPADELTTIGEGAFGGCSGLKEVTMLSEKMASIKSTAFLDSGLKTVYVTKGQKDNVIAAGLNPAAGGFEIKEISGIETWEDPETSILWSYRTIGDEAEIYSGGSYASAIDSATYGPITVPAEIYGYVVTRIGDSAFYYCNNITSVTLPGTVTRIDENAFNGCADMESVNVPDGVTAIGECAFSGCAKLESVNIPDGVAMIWPNTFYGCAKLMSVNIPDSVTSIGDCAFMDCYGLASVTIGNGVTSIGYMAFAGCSEVTTMTIGDGVTDIGDSAFAYCSKLKDVSIPEDVTHIGNAAFCYCNSLESISIPNGVTSIEDDTFMGCTALADVQIGDSVESIGCNAFKGCALTSVDFPYSMKNIEASAFEGCVNLTSANIPYGVENIGYSAFEGCSALAEVTIPSTATSIGGAAFKGCAFKNVEIPSGVTTIGSQTFEDCTALEIVTVAEPSSLTAIGGEAFKGCSDALVDVVIPYGVKSIGARAFEGCTHLKSVAIPSSVTHIGEYAFKDTALDTVFVEDMTSESDMTILLSSEALYDVGLITWVRTDSTVPFRVAFSANGGNCPVSYKTVHSGFAVGALPVATLEDYTFLGWFTASEGGTQISETTIVNDDVTYFAQWLAEGCSQETVDGIVWTYRIVDEHAEISNGNSPAIPTATTGAVTIPETLGGKQVTAIGAHAFHNCSAMTEVNIHAGVTSIGISAFAGCEALTSVTIPEGVTKIGAEAFYACNALTTVAILGNNADIGNGAFDSCINLENLTIQDGVTRIGECAFNNCYMALKEVSIPGSVTSIQESAFCNCTSLEKVMLQEGLEEIGARAFYGDGVLTQVVVPDSVTTIGEEAFAYCGNLNKVTLPIALKGTFDPDVFYGCSGDLEIIYHAVFTVTFDPNGGTVAETSRMVDSFSPSIGALPEPNDLAGYDFTGWYTDKVAGDLINAAYEVSANATFYAHWTPKTLTIAFDANGGEGGWINNMKYGEALSAPTVTRTGYTFAGWQPTIPGTVPAENATYVAQWTLNKYKITFDANGGTYDGGDMNIDYGSAYGELPTPTREGYTFMGWTVNGEAVTSENLMGADDVSLVANWQINQYTVTFDANGGAVSPSERSVDYGAAVGELPVPTLAGYTFDGWFTELVGGEAISAATEVLGDVTCYAHWSVTPPSYCTITLDANGGSVSPSTRSVAVGSPIDSLPEPVRTGWTFDGWFTEADGGQSVILADVVTSDVTYYAHWTLNAYTVTFDANGGAVSPTERSVDYGATVGELPVPTLAGYTFDGWFTELVGGEAISAAMEVLGDVTCYAHWSVTPPSYCTITLDANGGSVSPSTRSVAVGSPIDSLPEPVRTGWTFDGWFTEADGGQSVILADAVTSDVTYYAHWTLNAYTVTFDANGGVGGVTKELGYGTEIIAPVVSREGYTFAGWQPALPETVPASNVTYVAQWTEIVVPPEPIVPQQAWKVTLDAQGGEVAGGNAVFVEKGKAVGKLPEPTRKGYTFNGWFTKASGGTQVKTTTKVKKNVTYYAQWTVNKYKIKFDKNGGSGSMKTLSATYGKNVTLTANAFKRTNYTFQGWATSANGEAVYADKAKVKNLTDANGKTVKLYAAWKRNSYTVKFNANGGEGGTVKQTVNCGEKTALNKNAFTREGYQFAGWATKKNGSVTYKNKAKVTDLAKNGKSVTLYAVWKPAKWAIGTFEGEGEIGGKAAKVTLTVSSAGKISGKFVVTKGNKSYSFKADNFDGFADGALRATTTMKYGSKSCTLMIAIGEDAKTGKGVPVIDVIYKDKEYGWGFGGIDE